MDNSTSSQLAALNTTVRTLSAAKIPLALDGRRQLTEVQNLLGQLESSVDAVMDREEKRVLIRELPRRSGGWAFRFDIDKIADEEHARAVGSVGGSQAKYELVVSCRSRSPEFLISTFESGGTQSKRIPWNIDLGAGAYQIIRLRIDSNPAFSAPLVMHGYGNQGQVELGAEFLNLHPQFSARGCRYISGRTGRDSDCLSDRIQATVRAFEQTACDARLSLSRHRCNRSREYVVKAAIHCWSC